MQTKVSAIQQIYKDIKSTYKKIMSSKPFEKYGRNDCFHFMDEDGQGMCIFSDSVWKGHPGVQLFINKPGLNHVHDLVTCPHSYGYDRSFANVVAVAYVPKEDLDEADKIFLKQMKSNVTASNLLIFILKEGRGFTKPTKSDMLNLLYHLTYLKALVLNDEEQLKEIFNNELMALGVFNNESMTYNVGPLPDISFERLPSLKKPNLPFIEEAKKHNYINEKCHIGRLYIPIKDSNNDYFSSVIFAYLEKTNKWYTNIIDCKPEKISDYIFAFLDDLFAKHGIPDEIEIADRYLFAGLNKTLNKLNVSSVFIREENDFARGCYEKLAEVLTRLSMLNEKFESMADDMDEEEFMRMLESNAEELLNLENELELDEEDFGMDDEEDFELSEESDLVA